MSTITGSLTATGSVVLAKKSSDTLAVVQLTGTYGSVQFVIEGTLDGTNYVPLAATNQADGSVASSTLSPADNSSVSYRVACAGFTAVQARVTSIGSGTAAFFIYSGSFVGLNPTTVTSNSSLGATAFTGALTVSSTVAVTSASATSLVVGPNGATNPTLQVDGSTSSAATGLKVKSAAAAAGVALSVVSSGTNENLTVDAKGSGTITFGSVSTGNIVLSRDLASSKAITSSAPTGNGIGYATGAGGAVTQATDRSTGVTLSKLTGQITTATASLAAGAEAKFTVTNTTVAATDTVIVSVASGNTGVGTCLPWVSAVAAGSFDITITNTHASTAEVGAVVLNYSVLKAVAS